MSRKTWVKCLGLLSFLLGSPALADFTYEGYLTTTAGVPVSDSSVVFKVAIVDSSQTCILYEESQTLNLSTSATGYYSMTIGSIPGAGKRSGNDSGNAFEKVFAGGSINGKLVSNGSACNPTQNVTDTRYLLVTVTPSSTGTPEALSPNIAVNSTARATVAQTLDGFGPAQLLKVNTSGPMLSQANLENVFSSVNYGKLTSLLALNASELVTKPTNGGMAVPSSSGTPSSAAIGQMWFDSTTGDLKYMDGGGTTQTISNSGGGGSLPALTSGKIWVGNGSNLATEVTPSGDVTMNNSGAFTLAGILPVTKGGIGTAGLTANSLLMMNGTGTQAQGMTCGFNEILKWNGTAWVCSPDASGVQGGFNSGALVLGTSDANALQFGTNGLTRMVLDSNGSLGIGTTTPMNMLDLYKDQNAADFISVTNPNAGASARSGVMAKNDSNHSIMMSIMSSTAATDPGVGTISTGTTALGLTVSTGSISQPLVFKQGSNERMRIAASSGKIGVGTASPLANLHLFTPSSSQDMFRADCGSAGFCQGIFAAGPTRLDIGVNDGTNKVYVGSNSSSPLEFRTSNMARMTIDPAGNVGIGVATTTYKVDIQGSSGMLMNLQNTNSMYNSGISFNDNTGTQMGTLGYGNSGGSAPYASVMHIGTPNSTPLVFITNNAERMRVDSAGMVGIGTNVPTSPLYIYNENTSTVNSSAVSTNFSVNPTSSASFASSAATASTLTYNSNYGIGTVSATSSNVNLNAGGSIGSAYGLNALVNNSAGIVTNAYGVKGTVINNSTIANATGGSFYVMASGNSITSAYGVRADVAQGSGAISNAYGVYVGNIAGAVKWSLYASDSSAPSYFAGNVGIGISSPAYPLDVNGDVNIAAANALRFGGTSVCTVSGCTASSDRRLKENIQPLSGSLEKILRMEGVQYNYRDKAKFTDKHQIGVIAQDVEEIYPEVVVTDSQTGYKAVAYDHLVAPLIEAVKSIYGRLIGVEAGQSQQAREIASLKAELASKDERIHELERKEAETNSRLERIERALGVK